MISGIIRPRSPNADRVASSLSGASAVGDFRAALEHDAARGFAAAARRCAQCWRTAFSFREVARLEQIPEEERLDPEAVMEAIVAEGGRPAFYEKDAAHIVDAFDSAY